MIPGIWGYDWNLCVETELSFGKCYFEVEWMNALGWVVFQWLLIIIGSSVQDYFLIFSGLSLGLWYGPRICKNWFSIVAPLQVTTELRTVTNGC